MFDDSFTEEEQSVNLKITLEDSRGKKSKEIKFEIAVIKKVELLVCTIIPKTIPDAKLVKQKTTCGKESGENDFLVKSFES